MPCWGDALACCEGVRAPWLTRMTQAPMAGAPAPCVFEGCCASPCDASTSQFRWAVAPAFLECVFFALCRSLEAKPHVTRKVCLRGTLWLTVLRAVVIPRLGSNLLVFVVTATRSQYCFVFLLYSKRLRCCIQFCAPNVLKVYFGVGVQTLGLAGWKIVKARGSVHLT